MVALNPLLQLVSFGDCDPAGIVFYPNIFRWMDAAFHHGIDSFGGHHQICARLDAIGMGLLDAKATFRAAMRPGDQLTITPTIAEWSRKTVTLAYRGTVEDRVTFTSQEIRGLFRNGPDGLTAGEISGFRDMIEASRDD